MSVTLRERKNKDGTTSFRLDIHHDGIRTLETIKGLKLLPATSANKVHNANTRKKAEEVAITKAADLIATGYNVTSDTGKNTIVTAWMEDYVNTYDKKDVRNMQGVTKRFEAYLLKINKPKLTFGNLDALLIESFIDYLEANSTGEGAKSYYKRFAKMIRHAYRKKLMRINVLDFVEKKVKGVARKKDVLTIAEIHQLAGTHTDSKNVKNAFLFACVTGLRFVDVKALQWQHINLSNRQMKLPQSKTGFEVVVPLNDSAIKLMGEPQKSDLNVFTVPSHNGVNKTLKAWVKRAGISKAITFHNGRHSYGTNLIFKGVDILTTSKLMGQTSTSNTQRYVTASDEMKRTATDLINIEL